MSIIFRTYNPAPLFGEDYIKLRNFLIKLDSHIYHFGRWDWMITHSYLDINGLDKIGLWEDSGELVAAATYDCQLGDAYLLVHEGYRHLGEDMLLYAKSALANDGKFRVVILDGDLEMQDTAYRNGFIATQDNGSDAVFPIGDPDIIRYSLPEGFRLIGLEENPSAYEVGRVMWNGFNHEANGEGPFSPSPDDLESVERQLHRPNVDLTLKIAVVAPDGHFASFCGMWYDAACGSALVEPVATDPAYRNMGLGKAAVLEGIRRCGKLGAKRAFVGSSQQFYYSIGFRPLATSTFWEMK